MEPARLRPRSSSIRCKDFLECADRRPSPATAPRPPPLTRRRRRRAEITQFNELVQSITKLFEAHAQQIQTEKLKSIGLRNIIDMQKENSRRRERQLHSDVDDASAELERCAGAGAGLRPCPRARAASAA